MSDLDVKDSRVHELVSNNVKTSPSSGMGLLAITKLVHHNGASIGAPQFLLYEIFSEYGNENVIIAPDVSGINAESK